MEASRSSGAQACDCERGRLWVRSPLEEIKIFNIVRVAIAIRFYVETTHYKTNVTTAVYTIRLRHIYYDFLFFFKECLEP